MAVPFELINLLASTLLRDHDDLDPADLDPADFLDNASGTSETLSNPHDVLHPNDLLTLSHDTLGLPLPSLSGSLLTQDHSSGQLQPQPQTLSLLRLLALLTYPLDALVLLPLSLFHAIHNYGARQASGSPLQHLLEVHQALRLDLDAAVVAHETQTEAGDDCSQVRAHAGSLMARLSENCLHLQQAYHTEASDVSAVMENFETWQHRRQQVVRRVQRIKSEANTFGAKLGGLLEARDTLDAEIAALQTRLAELTANKATLNREINETISVLESRLAKHVNAFKDMEARGREAVMDYLLIHGVPEQHMGAFLRYEPVEAAFQTRQPQKPASLSSTASTHTTSPPLRRSINTDMLRRSLDKSDTSVKPPEPDHQSMGIQAFEVPDIPDHEGPAPLQPVVHDLAYDKGFAQGAKQFESFKNRVAAVISSLMDPAPKPKPTYRKLDDSLNTITQQLDIKPILDHFASKAEALQDLLVESSKMAEEFHRQATTWSSECQFLITLEDNLQSVTSDLSNVLAAVTLLESAFDHISHVLENQKTSSAKVPVSKVNYLQLLLERELYTIAVALDQLLGTTYYSTSVKQPDTLLLKSQSLGKHDLLLRLSSHFMSVRHVLPDYNETTSDTKPDIRPPAGKRSDYGVHAFPVKDKKRE